MAHITADRVADVSTSIGTGSFVVSGTAPIGYRTLSAVLAVADTFWYAIQHQTLNEWEVGLGTYSAANTFARTTILSSSNAGSIVTFSAGDKDVFITIPAAKGLLLDNAGISNVPVGIRQKVFVAGTQYTPAADVKAIEVWLTAGGGAGGSAGYTSSASNIAAAGAGGGGGTVMFVLGATDLFTAGVANIFTIVVGAGGTGPTSVVANGTTGPSGGESRFFRSTALVVAVSGGVGGTGAAYSQRNAGGAGGTLTVSTGLTAGQYTEVPGTAGSRSTLSFAGSSVGYGALVSSLGGGSFYGSGASMNAEAGGTAVLTTATIAGASATAVGAGGGGGGIRKIGTLTTLYSAAGGNGARGLCVIREVYA